MSLVSPNNTLANVVNDPIDLVGSRIHLFKKGVVRKVVYHVGAQLNGFPHVGTYLVLASAFVAAQKTKAKFGIEGEVHFVVLDNVSYKIVRNDQGKEYQTTYADALGIDEIKKIVGEYYGNYVKSLSNVTSVAYVMQTYTEQQATMEFRQQFINIAPKLEKIDQVIFPSNFQDGRKGVRIPNKMDHLSEKYGYGTKIVHCAPEKVEIQSVGFDGKTYNSKVLPTNGKEVYLDLNTLTRNVVKELMCMEEAEQGVLNVMVKGSDWSFAATLLDAALGVMGKTTLDAPLRLYIPQIVTETGEKLSKSSIQSGTQKNKMGNKRSLDARKFWSEGGNGGDDDANQFVGLVNLFMSNTKHMFRNYSFNEFERLSKL